MKFSAGIVSILLSFALSGCASKYLKYDKEEDLKTVEEYDNVLQVKTLDPAQPPAKEEKKAEVSADQKKPPKDKDKKKKGKGKSKKKKKADTQKKPVEVTPEKTSETPPEPKKRQPELEDTEGFVGRRPAVDPFRIGEKLTMRLTYFGVEAGTMTMEIKPLVEVNGRKAYHMVLRARSSKVFSMFYSVDDWAETFIDYERLIPFNYAIHVRESKQLREVRSYFDWDKNMGFIWDKKVTDEKGVREKKLNWEILPYSQNVFSAAFYLRTFQLRPGKNLAYRVAHEGKNLVFTGKVLRREKLRTDIGILNTVVIRPKVTIEGVFKPIGEILMWLTDDDRKFLVKIQSKIKIGKIVGYVEALDKGR